MRAVWAIIKAIAKGHGLRHVGDVGLEVGQLGRCALVVCPPAVWVGRAVVGGGESGEVSIHVAFDGDVGRDAGLDGVPLGQGDGVRRQDYGGSRCWEISELGNYRRIGVSRAFGVGICGVRQYCIWSGPPMPKANDGG